MARATEGSWTWERRAGARRAAREVPGSEDVQKVADGLWSCEGEDAVIVGASSKRALARAMGLVPGTGATRSGAPWCRPTFAS